MMSRCVADCGVLQRSYLILRHDVTFEARTLCSNLTLCTALWK